MFCQLHAGYDLICAVQIRQLFAFCGSVTNVVMVGSKSQYALVEYATAQVIIPFQNRVVYKSCTFGSLVVKYAG